MSRHDPNPTPPFPRECLELLADCCLSPDTYYQDGRLRSDVAQAVCMAYRTLGWERPGGSDLVECPLCKQPMGHEGGTEHAGCRELADAYPPAKKRRAA